MKDNMINNKSIDFFKLEEEVIKAKYNNKDSKEYIINIFMPFILKTTHEVHIPSHSKEDIKQELISSLLYAINKYNGSNSFFWYAIQSMKNNIYSKLRKFKKEDNNIYIDNLEIENHDENLDKNLLKQEEIENLQKALRTLGKSDFDILYKTFFLEYSYKDLIKETNLKYSTLACRKSQALKKLKKTIASY